MNYDFSPRLAELTVSRRKLQEFARIDAVAEYNGARSEGILRQ